jgi:nicotinamide N-methyltransferase
MICPSIGFLILQSRPYSNSFPLHVKSKSLRPRCSHLRLATVSPSTCRRPPNPLVSSPSADVLRASVLTTTTDRPNSSVTYPYSHQSHLDDPFSRAQPSSAFLGPSPILHETPTTNNISGTPGAPKSGSTITYHGVCLTVWSHADAERTAAIRRTLESTASNRSRKESSQSLVAARLRSLRGETGGSRDVTLQARKKTRSSAKSPWGATTDAETDAETDLDGQISESDYDVASTVHNPGESTLFLPADSVFWLPYALE